MVNKLINKVLGKVGMGDEFYKKFLPGGSAWFREDDTDKEGEVAFQCRTHNTSLSCYIQLEGMLSLLKSDKSTVVENCNFITSFPDVKRREILGYSWYEFASRWLPSALSYIEEYQFYAGDDDKKPVVRLQYLNNLALILEKFSQIVVDELKKNNG